MDEGHGTAESEVAEIKHQGARLAQVNTNLEYRVNGPRNLSLKTLGAGRMTEDQAKRWQTSWGTLLCRVGGWKLGSWG